MDEPETETEVQTDLNARMRAGYRNAEGEWLRARHHQITDQIHDLRCYR